MKQIDIYEHQTSGDTIKQHKNMNLTFGYNLCFVFDKLIELLVIVVIVFKWYPSIYSILFSMHATVVVSFVSTFKTFYLKIKIPNF